MRRLKKAEEMLATSRGHNINGSLTRCHALLILTLLVLILTDHLLDATHCSNAELVSLIGLILQMRKPRYMWKGYLPRSQPARNRTGFEAKQSDSKSCALSHLKDGPNYLLIVASRAGPQWLGCRVSFYTLEKTKAHCRET